MMRRLSIAIACLLASASPALAQQEDDTHALKPGAGIDLFSSTDGDNTDVTKLAGRALIDYRGQERFVGVAYERAWFKPLGQTVRTRDRGYIEAADVAGNWRWSARVGTDGDTILGSADLRSADWSKEVFVEREIIETPRGVDEGIYYTFAGASFDIPAGKRDTLTAMAGVQAFTGSNVRLHLRGNYTHVLKEDWGLSLQLNARYYHSTHPGEADYYSPEDYLQLLPVLQMRRISGGWEYKLRGGYGAQKATYADWADSRYAAFSVKSPLRQQRWQLVGEITYSNISISSGPNYDYLMGTLGIAMAF